jgi:dihydropteroate synthase
MISSRLIFISSKSRIAEISNTYQIKKTLLKTADYLFLLENLSPGMLESLKKSASHFDPFFQLLKSYPDKVLLKIIPENSFLEALDIEDFEKDLAAFMARIKTFFLKKESVTWKTGRKDLIFDNLPLIMGILNITPDSFSDGGLYKETDKAVEHALQMAEEGANIIDIGGESTRPGAQPVSEAEEMNRVLPVIEKIREHSDIFISVDTYKSGLAEAALQKGADIVNDISATTFDEQMQQVIKKNNCPLVIMHCKGRPQDMQNNPQYGNVCAEIYRYLEEKSLQCAALNDDKIIIDPGIGFGKTVQHNLTLIKNLKDFSFINRPLLIGLSRKSFIKGVTGADIKKRLTGSLISEFYSVLNGAAIIRVHDVSAANEARKMLLAIQNI